jgi:hypothetical protein
MFATADHAFLNLLAALRDPQKYQIFWLGDILVIDASDCAAALMAATICRNFQKDFQFSAIRIYCGSWFYCQLERLADAIP